MKKTLLIATACIIAVIVTIIIIKTDAVSVNIQIETSKDTVGKEDSSAVSGISFGINPRNSTYFFENGPVTLIDGYEEKEIVPGAASRQVTQYSGNEIKADLNNDQIEDAVFVLTQSQGGSGTFFYVAAALGSAQGYQGTNVILLGDRISPLAVTVENGAITVSYLERKPEEPMTGKPSISVSKQLRLENGKLVETADR